MTRQESLNIRRLQSFYNSLSFVCLSPLNGVRQREEALKLTMAPRRYGVVLNFLTRVGSANWAQIKGVIEAKESHSVKNAAVSNLLSTLVKAGLVGKTDGKYAIADALLVNGVKEEALPEQVCPPLLRIGGYTLEPRNVT